LKRLKNGKSSSQIEEMNTKMINKNEMNRRIRQKIAGGYFSEATYKECIADELNRAGKCYFSLRKKGLNCFIFAA
jgi:hypothetical protein